MNRVVGDDAFGLVVIVAACIQVAVEPREIATGNLYTKRMACLEVIAGV
jgi:hypothetical protein